MSQHLLISGRVQGVSYRHFTKTRADELKVTGWVRNLDDGRVEAIVQGDEAALESLLTKLRKGPMLSRVDEVKINRISLKEAFDEFQIRANSATAYSSGVS